MKTTKIYRQTMLSAFLLTPLLLVACGSGGNGSNVNGNNDEQPGDRNGQTINDGSKGGITGTWRITETAKENNCGQELPLETFSLKVSIQGNQATIVDDDGNRSTTTISGKKFSWSSSEETEEDIQDGTPQGTITYNPISVTIDDSCNSLQGMSNWRWVATNDPTLTCSGTTKFSGTRSPANGCGDFAPGTNDERKPDTPSNFTIQTPVKAGTLAIKWDEAADNVEVMGYKIYRGNPLKYYDTVYADTLSYSDTNLVSGEEYCYAVATFDTAGNESIPTATQCASVL